MKKVTRRQFLKGSTAAAAGVVTYGALGSVGGKRSFASRTLMPLSQDETAQAPLGNPLEAYPNRGWERVYDDQYSYDDSFTWVCSPNDTHACRMRAFVKNGVVMRSEQN